MNDHGPAAGSGEEGQGLLPLPGNRLDVVTELRSYCGDAAAIYEGGLWVLEQRDNPKRVRIAAAAMRDVMDELGKNVGVRSRSGLKARVNELRDEWEKVPRAGGGGIEGETAPFAGRLDAFFALVDDEHPKARERMMQTVRGISAVGASSAPEAESERVDTLMRIDARMNRGAHGSSSYTSEEIEADIELLGSVILDLRRPPVAADLSEIEALIGKGPPNG